MSPAMNEIVNNTLNEFKSSGLSENTYSGSVSFYDDPTDFDLRLGVGWGKYSMSINTETKVRGIINRKEVTAYQITVTISDTYNFDSERPDTSLTNKLNNWGYEQQEKENITPFEWSFTYSLEYE
jgi:hypothetical protein